MRLQDLILPYPANVYNNRMILAFRGNRQQPRCYDSLCCSSAHLTSSLAGTARSARRVTSTETTLELAANLSIPTIPAAKARETHAFLILSDPFCQACPKISSNVSACGILRPMHLSTSRHQLLEFGAGPTITWDKTGECTAKGV